MSGTDSRAVASLSLYEIASEFRSLEARLRDMGLDEQTIADTLEGESGPLEKKLAAVVAVSLSMDDEAEVIERRLVLLAEKRRDALRARAKRLRDYAIRHMVECGQLAIDRPDLRFRVRDNPWSIRITDEKAIPDRYKHTTVVPAQTLTTIDTDQLKRDAIEATKDEKAAPIAGVSLTRGKRLEIY